jgi:hypothetical protein
VNWREKAAAGVAAGALLVVGCTAAAHLSALQPGPVPSSGSAAVPSSLAREYRIPKIQLGVDVDAYTYPGEDMAKAAQAVVKYVRSLHANAISVTFPFFMNGPHAATVTTRSSTPTPHMVEVFARIAEAHGLYVAFRPLLDEASIDHGFRGNLQLSHPAEWFASYRRFLLSYAKVAQRAKVQEFVVGTELSTLYKSPRWYPLDAAMRRVYDGTLAFDSNWYGVSSLQGAGGKGLAEGVDAYPAIPTHISEGWKLYDHRLPRGTVEMEVGIAAVRGASAAPFKHSWPGKPIDGKVQAEWFSAACHAAAEAHLGGIYFWSIGLGPTFAGPTAANSLNWGGGSPGSKAIADCFKSLSGKASR